MTHTIHNHPGLESKINLDENQVIVDIDFIGHFSKAKYCNPTHVIVDKAEFEQILQKQTKITISADQNTIIIGDKVFEFMNQPFVGCNECDLKPYCRHGQIEYAPCTSINRKDRKNGWFQEKQNNKEDK